MLRAVFIPAMILWASISCANDLPYVPSPAGFVESSTLVPALKEQALLGHPADTRLIGVYLLPDELATIMHGGKQQMSIFCRAYVIHESTTDTDAKTYFHMLVTSTKKEGLKPFSLDDPDSKRIVQGYIDATKQKQGQSVGLTGATILGSIVDTDEAYGNSMVAALKVETDKGEISVPITGSVVWALRGRYILEISAATQFAGLDSVNLAAGVVTSWIKAVALPGQSP